MIASTTVNSILLAVSSLIGFGLLVAGTCSVPVSQAIYLWKITVNRDQVLPYDLPDGRGTVFPLPDGDMRGGILGFCATWVNELVTGSTRMNSDLSIGRQCSATNAGYSFRLAQSSRDSTRYANMEWIVDDSLTQSMVLAPLAAGLAGFALIVSLVAIWRKGSGASKVAAIPTGGAAIFAWVAFGVSHASTMQVKHKIENDRDLIQSPDEVLEFSVGQAAFLLLGAALALTIGTGAWLVVFMLTRKQPKATDSITGEGSHSSSSSTVADISEPKRP